MINLIVRKSGLSDKFYIDYQGQYKIQEISKSLGIDSEAIKAIYVSYGGIYDDTLDVYYFSDIQLVKDAAQDIVKKLKPSQVEITVKLTFQEIEYIRKALINEDSNVIFTGNKLRESIFKKLNA